MERSLAHVRSQAAFVRSLLDEVERVTASVPPGLVSAQLIEELARLGCRFLEVASDLTRSVPESSETETEEEVRQCA
jgi:hypothetical protein